MNPPSPIGSALEAMDTPESRLKAAVGCGVVRDGHQLTLARLDDVRGIAEACAIFEREGKSAREENAQLKRERDALIRDKRELRAGIAEAILKLQETACF